MKIIMAIALVVLGTSFSANAERMNLNPEAVAAHIVALNQRAAENDTRAAQIAQRITELKAEKLVEARKAAPGKPQVSLDRVDPEAGPIHTARHNAIAGEIYAATNDKNTAQRAADEARKRMRDLNDYNKHHERLVKLDTDAKNNPRGISERPMHAREIHALEQHIQDVNRYITENNLHTQ
ncbi:MAG: hypothetical protein Q8S31_00055 [Alphaproteobacteria bacterium]|nr:hypothetical protein [Alphaproteobacteria bacterium]